jgi:hypothetical protein
MRFYGYRRCLPSVGRDNHDDAALAACQERLPIEKAGEKWQRKNQALSELILISSSP